MSTRPSYDHYISAAHIRKWATNNQVMVQSRGQAAKKRDVGKLVAAEQGLNIPSIEAAYGRVESAFARALPRLISFASRPSNCDWLAVRAYAVLLHDRYPGLRGSAASRYGLPGGNAMMVPNPAHWGTTTGAYDPLAQLATKMDREQLKEMRLQLLQLNAQTLPRINQVFHVGPMLLGDASIHSITFHPNATTARTYVAMPLTPGTIIVFGNQLVEEEEVPALARSLNMKIAAESTLVIDTPQAPIIKGLVAEMWSHQLKPSGTGLPKAVHLWSRVEDIPKPRPADSGYREV